MLIAKFKKLSSPLIIFILTLTFYSISAGTKIDEQTKTPQHGYLANSLLHGRVDLMETPPSRYDLIYFHEHWYVAGGLTPALLLVPAVLLFGVGISDVLFGVIIGALNAALMFVLLDRLNPQNPAVRNWLTVLFIAGTSHWWLSSVGSVWFNAQLVALSFMLLFVIETLGTDRPWLAGAWLGLAVLSRPTTLFASLFYLVLIHFKEHKIAAFLRKVAPFLVTLLGFVFVLLGYNYLRFGSLLDFGYQYVAGSEPLIGAYTRTGGFNPIYMPCNAYVSLIGLPNLPWSPLPTVNTVCPHLNGVRQDFSPLSSFFNPLGMSLFITTPAFLLIFRNRKDEPRVVAAWAGILGVLVPLWMYHTTGWVQFGYRYVTDFMVFLFILLSFSINKVQWLEVIVLVLSLVMGFIGLYLMYYMTLGLRWDVMFVKGVGIVRSFMR